MRISPMKRMLSLLLVVSICFGMLPTATSAQAMEGDTYTLASGIKAATDDMEESIDGSDPGKQDYKSSDLELGVESPGGSPENSQYIGLRFADLAIPKGAVVTSAYIQFAVDENKNSDPFAISIYAENADSSVTFNNGDASSSVIPYDISSRTKTSESVTWTLTEDQAWTVDGTAGADQRTCDLSTLVQAVINRDGWMTGNAMTFIMSGTGNRTAISYDRDPAQAAVLNLTYTYDGNAEQSAPAGLCGISPTTDGGSDGQITGTSADMEYKVSSAPNTAYTVCPDTAVTGLAADSYDVRYAAKEGYNASPAVAVIVPAYTPYAVTNVTFQPGSDESEMNFAWYSNRTTSTQSVIQIALKSDMTGSDFPVGACASFTGTITGSNGFQSNEGTVTGLQPSTEYVYRLGDGTSFSDVCSFATHDASSYSAIFVGDPQIGSSGSITNDTAGWQNTLNQALSSFPNTSFILSAGDQVQTSSSEAQYSSFFDPDQLLSTPLIPTIGNHDNSALYSYHFNSPNESTTYGTTSAGGDYSFVYGNTLYMVLNSNNESVTSHDVFMQQAINAAGTGIQWKIVMFHHSIYSSATHSTDGDILSRRSDLYPVFDKYDMDVVLMGHDHCYTRSYQMEGGVAQNTLENSAVNPTGTLYITANSASGSKYYDLKSADTGYAAVRWQEYSPSFSNVIVNDSTFTITTYRSDTNAQIDTYTITKDQSGAPTGLAGVASTTVDNNDGKITGTTTAMEYKISADTVWSDCSDNETIGLPSGTYAVRYAAVGSSSESVPAIVVVAPSGIVRQSQVAPAGLVGVAPTTEADNNGMINGTTAAMEYKLSADTTWTTCVAPSVTGLVPGSYDVRYAQTAEYYASISVTVKVPTNAEGNSYSLTASIGNDTDDMEEWMTGDNPGKMDLDSGSIEIGSEIVGVTQYVGLCFANLSIPKNATITGAYIQFTAYKDKSTNPFAIDIYAENADNSVTFNNGSTDWDKGNNGTLVMYDISGRARTAQKATWTLTSGWSTIDAAGEGQRTCDVSALVQAVIDREGWATGNAVTFIMSGSGIRSAYSYDRDSAKAPVLHLTYTYNGKANQSAATGLTGIAPTAANKNDGQIAGTTTSMEYKPSSASETSYTVCPDMAVTGLTAGSYDVRYAAKEGYNASPAVTITVPAYVPYAATYVTFQPGDDESKMNFNWYSNLTTSTQSVVQVALKSDMTGAEFPAGSAVTFKGTLGVSNGYKTNKATVTGLTPSTEYVYRLGDGTSFSSVNSFSTQDATKYNVLFVGDPQIGSSGSVSSDTTGWFYTVLNSLNQFPDTSFILSAGDQVDKSTNESQYEGFFYPPGLQTVPVVPTIGNHDNSALYASHFNSPNESTEYGTTSAGGDYSFVYGNTLYMVLNSNNQSATSHDAFMQQAMDAAGTGIKWEIVMFHHSIYSSADHSTDGDILSRRSDLYPIFDKHDIDVVLMGHDHCYTRSYQMEGGIAQNGLESSVVDPKGTLYITANSGSGSKYYDLESADTEYAAVRWQGRTPSYSNIAVSDNSFTITTYRTDTSEVIDTYTITKSQDSEAPALTAGTASRTSASAATVKFTSNEAGTYFYRAVAAGASVPAIDTSGQGIYCAANTTVTISLVDLSSSGAKDIYLVVKDNAGNASAALKIAIPAYSAPSSGNTGGDTTTTTPHVESNAQGGTTTTGCTVTGSANSLGKTAGRVDAKTASALVAGAKAAEKSGNKAVVEIQLERGKSATAAEITIPKDSFSSLATGTHADLTVDAGIGTVTFDSAAVDAINTSVSSGDIKISLAKADISDLSDEGKAQVGNRPVYDFTVTSGSNTISNFGGGRTYINLPYTASADEDPNAIVIYYISDAGKLETVRGNYNASARMVEFTTTHFSKYAVGYHKVTFSDVVSTDWYDSAVSFLAARAITTGTGGGAFSPDATLTRGQFIVMLMRAYGIEADTNYTDNFYDAGNTYYTDYLASAKRLGITNGVGNNNFAPDNEITRQDMFTLLYCALNVLGELPTATGSQTTGDFSDAGKISSYAQNAMNVLVKAGIISGSDGKLNPTGTATRAEMAQVLCNVLSA